MPDPSAMRPIQINLSRPDFEVSFGFAHEHLTSHPIEKMTIYPFCKADLDAYGLKIFPERRITITPHELKDEAAEGLRQDVEREIKILCMEASDIIIKHA